MGNDDAIVLAVQQHDNEQQLLTAARHAGLQVLTLDPADPPTPRPGLAWRLPVGMVVRLQHRGLDLRLAVAPPAWVAGLPVDVLGRTLRLVEVQDLLAGGPQPDVRSVKAAQVKWRSFPARRVGREQDVRALVRDAGLPAGMLLLLGDGWLVCDSEYRAFTVGREVVACSPYLVEGEGWSPLLTRSRASFHDDAAVFAASVLRSLPEGEVPPACALDVARLPDGRFCLLEVNTVWGAGLYGCDPAQVLRSVLAAQDASPRWRFALHSAQGFEDVLAGAFVTPPDGP